MMTNPILFRDSLPLFDQIKPSHISPAIEGILKEANSLIHSLKVMGGSISWENFVEPIEMVSEKISRAWGQIEHLNAVVNSDDLRKAYNDNLIKLTEFYTNLSQDEALYKKYQSLKDGEIFKSLTPSQKRIIDNVLREFKLGGAELNELEKARFKVIQEKLAKLSTQFEENILDATNEFSIFVGDADNLKGIPEENIKKAQSDAIEDKKEGYKLTLHFPSYLPVMQYAEDRNLREKLYRGYATRASELASPKFDNTKLIDEILALRYESAKLLGFNHFTEMSLVTKMAKSNEEVVSFLMDLANKAKPFALKDMEELSAFSKTLGIEKLEAWDIAYVSEKLRQAKYSFSENEVKQYFPEHRVLKGLFKVVETIFKLKIIKTDAPTWHKDVSFYSIKNDGDELVGQFYFDLYARNHKRGGAWMDEAISRYKNSFESSHPVAFLTCNFSSPSENKPALFSHDDVITLFHEFGHGLHHMLTKVDEYSISGIKGVEWDAVELPSQFMENFCWEWDVVKHMTEHVDNKSPLPEALFKKMIEAKNFQSGMQTLRQIEFSLFDIRLHTQYNDQNKINSLKLLETIRDEIAVVRPPAWNRFPNSFSHIFAGGYAAGYYSYKWAEVLASDAFSLFEEEGILSSNAGQKFQEEVLSKGGSRPAMESFVAFRGRAPSVDALLRHSGMA
ncbi:M3 family metallopeptidase [Candidatus Methylopumilus planktonicus]|nr:M3 family metallopeptidase [Candidatus Methylopumilus planktonicus]QDD23991.1 M3 family metallopeptidase [Candidatus Methylopumilus planktonicus]